jgi:NodT family efflux transporter outer membrane factor (OMF) lipoprotein
MGRVLSGCIGTFVAFATTVLMVGCTTLGPDYHEPDIAWLKAWQSDLYGQIERPDQQREVDLRFWWCTFNDPVLHALIDTARRENPSLRSAGLKILESRAALGIASANQNPSLHTNAIYVDSRTSGGTGADRDFSYGVDFSLAWELDFWGRFRRGVESAEASFYASIANQQDAQVLLSAQVAELYYAYRTILLRIDIARENVVLQKRGFEIADRMYRSGQTPEFDMQQASAQHMDTQAVVHELEADLVRFRNGLAALLGRMPGDVPELASVGGSLPVATDVSLHDAPARLLLRRRDLRAAAWQVAAQSAQIGIAKADYFPAITLLGNIGWSADTLDGSPKVRSATVGPALSWPLLGYGRIHNNVRL